MSYSKNQILKTQNPDGDLVNTESDETGALEISDFDTRSLLKSILIELRIINKHLYAMSDCEVEDIDVEK